MKTEKVFKRKKELIHRDPLYDDLNKTFQQIIKVREETKKNYLRYTIDDPVINEIKKMSPVNIFNNQHKFTEFDDGYENGGEIYKFLSSCKATDLNTFLSGFDKFVDYHKRKYLFHWKLLDLELNIKCKWAVSLDFNFANKEVTINPSTNDEAIWVGSPPVINGYEGVTINDFNKYPQLNWLPYPNPFNKKPVLADINEFVTPGYNETGETYIPIVINLSRLNNNDAKQGKKTIWEIIKSNLQKGVTRKLYDGESLNPQFAFLYGIRREETFHKYLWWYDYHMGEDYNTPKGFDFRRIARMNLSDLIKRKCPDKLKILDDQINEFKNISKDLKKKIQKHTSESIEWEDAVEKGVKLIYQAIHRKPYPAKKKAELFKEPFYCPIHREKPCPTDNCKNYEKYMKIFDNRYKLKKHITTSNPDSFAHPEGIQKPAKSLSLKIKGQQIKKEDDKE